jgi:hypothetical protein
VFEDRAKEHDIVPAVETARGFYGGDLHGEISIGTDESGGHFHAGYDPALVAGSPQDVAPPASQLQETARSSQEAGCFLGDDSAIGVAGATLVTMKVLLGRVGEVRVA